MRENTVKKALENNEQVYGCWVTIPHPLIPEILSPAKFDFLVVDMEHSAIGLNELLPMIISIEANNMIPLVRVGEHNSNLIKRVMDAGAYGIIAANVCSGEEAGNVVNAVKYPPIGTRGVGLFRAQGFGKTFEEYLGWVRDESLVIVQIEHIDAVENIDEIFKTPGVDGFIVGPYDLSGSLGKPGRFDDPEVLAALGKIMIAAKKYKMPAGFHSVSSDAKEASKRREEGYRLLAYSLDSMLLGDSAIEGMRKIRG